MRTDVVITLTLAIILEKSYKRIANAQNSFFYVKIGP